MAGVKPTRVFALASLAAPAAAAAATFGTNGSTLVYRSSAGETDGFFPTYRRNRDFWWVGADDPPFVNAGASCSKGDGPDRPFHTNDSGSRVQIVSCPAAGVRLADVQLGDGNDKMGIQRDEIYRADGEDDQALLPVHRLAVHADGGPGNDLIESGVFADVLFGGPGDDIMIALGGDDVIRGGPGSDLNQGGAGNDKIYGDAGPDRLNGFEGADKIYGGQGNDRIDGAGLSFGTDGRDSIYGGPGADQLEDGQRVKVTPGDRFFGGPGNDRIDDRDGYRDGIDCGAGRDLVLADKRDSVAGNCERVQREFRRPGIRS